MREKKGRDTGNPVYSASATLTSRGISMCRNRWRAEVDMVKGRRVVRQVRVRMMGASRE